MWVLLLGKYLIGSVYEVIFAYFLFFSPELYTTEVQVGNNHPNSPLTLHLFNPTVPKLRTQYLPGLQSTRCVHGDEQGKNCQGTTGFPKEFFSSIQTRIYCTSISRFLKWQKELVKIIPIPEYNSLHSLYVLAVMQVRKLTVILNAKLSPDLSWSASFFLISESVLAWHVTCNCFIGILREDDMKIL